MKTNKKTTTLFLLLVLSITLLSLTAISSADTNSTASVNSNHTEITQTVHEDLTDNNNVEVNNDNNIKTIKSEVKENTKSKTIQTDKTISTKNQTNKKTTTKNIKQAEATVTTFDELRNTINSNTDSSLTVTLTGEDVYLVTGEITTSSSRNLRDLTITGTGQTIDGQGQYRFLNINNNVNVKINGITIQNCKSVGSGQDGGTIVISTINQGSLTVNNTTFKDNVAGRHGGAISISKDTYLTISNSTFTGNNATQFGGAIYANQGYLTVTDSIFEYNAAPNQFAGAIRNSGHMTVSNSILRYNTAMFGGAIEHGNVFEGYIINCTIANNTASRGGGGIINTAYLTVTNSTIENNTAGMGGGGINNERNVTIENTTFKNNKAIGNGGAAINHQNMILKNVTITNSNATNGGAIYNNAKLIINNTNITNSKATTNGGAIYNNGNITINNTNITNNNGTDGGAIYNNANITVNNTNITNSRATTNGGAIYNQAGSIIANNTTITTNNAVTGGAIYNNANITVNNTNITNSRATTNGGAIYNQAGSIIANNTTITTNNAVTGGAIYNNANITANNTNITGSTANNAGAIYNNANITLNSSLINGSVAANYGGAIYNNANLTINNSNITGNKATNNRGTSLQGGAIYSNTGKINITNSLFANNTLFDGVTNQINGDGGAIYNNLANITITDSNMINNTALNGGVINNAAQGNITITGSKFTDNNATTGGVIYNLDADSTININTSTLSGNTAIVSGGAIYITNGILNINNSLITDNNATNHSGAIYNNGKLDIHNTSITNNNVTLWGGAINNDGTVTIDNSTINNNNASNAGAIYNKGVLNINNTIMNNNRAMNNITTTVLIDGKNQTANPFYGGAIYNNNNNGKVTINNSTMNNNTAGHGAVIYTDHGNIININNTIMNNNTAIYNSGVIHNREGTVNITNSTMNNNTAQRGGAIRNRQHGTININNVTFTNNNATNGGAINNYENGIITITNSNIIQNNATNQGGAIFNNRTGTLTITNTNITNNNATDGGAIYNLGTLTITNNNITDNNATGLGGTIYNDYANIEISNTKINNTSAKNGGTIYNNNLGYISINNVTIKNSTARQYGGAITNNGTININNTNITNNTALNGGAIYNNDTSTITIANSTMKQNTATRAQGGSGGVIDNEGIATITDSNLSDNNATNQGGAIYNTGNITINNTKIANNNATEGGAIATANFGNLTVNSTNITNSTATSMGGAIYNTRNIVTENTTFTNNTAVYGGAILSFGSVSLNNTNLTYNNATMGGAIFNSDKLTINNTLFDSNNATDGGAIANNNGNMEIINSILQNNNATDTGGAIYTQNGNMVLNNSVLFKNIVTENNNGYVVTIDGTSSVYNNSFYNNTDFKRDMLINDNSVTERINNNIYISNYLETEANTTLEDVTLDVFDEYYDVKIPLIIRDVYNSTVHNGNITVLINGEEYKTYPVKDSSVDIVIPKADFSETVNILTYKYSSPDLSYQPLTLENTVTVLKHNTTITIDPIKNTTYNGKVAVTGTLADVNGTELSNMEVVITINGVKYINTTDEKGRYTINNIPAEFGINNITAEFRGDNSYNKSENTSTFNGTAHDTKIILFNADSVLYDDNTTISGMLYDVTELKLIPDADITITVDGKTYLTKTNEQGIFTINNATAQYGINNVKASYEGNDSYNPSEAETTYNGLAHNTTITIDPVDDTLFDENVKITGTLKDVNNTLISGVTVDITVNGVKYSNTTDENGRYTINNVPVKINDNTVTATYLGNGSYIASENNTQFNGLKHETRITLEKVEDVLFNNKTTVRGTLTDANGTLIKGVYVTVNGESLLTDENGQFTTEIPADIDENTVNASYAGNEYYISSEANTNFNGLPHATEIILDDVKDVTFNNQTIISGTLRDINGTVIPNAVVKVGNITVITGKDGRFNATVTADLGDNEVRAVYDGDRYYNATSATAGFKGLKHDTKITVNPVEDILFDNKTVITGVLIDTVNSEIIPDADVTITVNEKAYNIRTNENGTYILEILAPLGKNTVHADYAGNGSYNAAETTTTTFTGLKHDTRITLDEISDVLFDGKTTVTGILSDINGTVIANAEVTVNGKPVPTDSEGRFTTTVDAALGLNTVTVNYIGNGSYNPSDDTNKFNGLKHDTRITVNNIDDIRYGETVTITGTLTDINNTAIANAEVTVIINGNRYPTTTNTNGTYTIPDITVQLGQNTVYVNYPGNGSYNPSEYSTEFNGLQHKTEVTVESIPDTLFDNTVTVTGVLTDADTQNIIPNAVITVTVNGKDIITATDADGRYTVENIPAVLGKNTVAVNYAGNASYTSSAGSTEFTGLPHDTVITLDDIEDVLFDDETVISGTLRDVNGSVIGNVEVTVNGETVTTDVDGRFTTTVVANQGVNDVTVVYNGNSSYNKAEVNTAFNGLPHDTTVTVNTIDNTKYGKLVNITGVLSDVNNTLIPYGKITVTVNDNTYYTVTDANGAYIVYNVPASLGTNTVKVNYDGNASYNPSENSTEFTGLKHDTKITVNNVTDRLFDDKATLVGVLFDLDDNLRLITDARVTVTINNNTYEVTTNSTGGYNITVPVQVGNNNVRISYDGNNYFNSAETTTEYTGLKHATIIELDDINDILFDGKTTVTGTLKDINGTVIPDAVVTVNGETLTTDTNGQFTVDVVANHGTNTVTAVYGGNDSYNSSENNTEFTGLKHETTVTVNSVESTQFDNVVQITGVLSDVNNTLIPNARITLTVNGNTYTTITDENGVYTLNNVSVVIGLNNVTVNYDGNDSYIAANNSIVFDGLKHDTVIILDQINNTIFDNTTTVAGILLDVNGNVIPYAAVIVNGETLTTDVNGRFTTTVTATLGENTVTAVYYGNDSYTNSNAASKFTGLKHDTRITVNDVDDTLFDNTVNITGVLTDINNTILSGATVDITVNGINYTAATDNNGRYTLYNVPVVRGVNFVVVSYQGNNSYNEVGQVTTTFNGLAHDTILTLDDVDDTLFDNTTVVTGQLTDVNGTSIPGATVTVNDAAVITDNNGRFTVNTTASLGKNTVTARYNGSYLYNNASDVTTTFNGLKHATDVTVNADDALFDKTTTITGVLRDANNTIIGNAAVTVTVNGVNYTTTTDASGVYTVENVPVVQGTNTVRVNYPGNDSYNATSSTATFNGLAHDTILTVNNVTDTLFDKTVNITGTLRDVNNTVIANAPVTVTVNGKTYTTATDENGVYTVINVPVVLGVNNVTASYAGNELYNRADDVTTTFNGLKHDTIIVLDDVENVSFNNKTSVSGILLDVNGTIITGAIVTVDNITTATDSNGRFTVEVTAKLGENTPVAVYNGNESYNSASNTTVFTGLPHNTIVTVNPIANTLYDNTVTVTGILRDVNGTIIPKADITVTVNGNIYNTITDANGAYTVQYVPVALGVNTVAVDYRGDNSYNPARTATTYNGLPHDTTITIDHVNDTLFDDTTSITGVLKDVNSTVIGNANIIVTVNGVTYTTTTNSNGVYVVNNIPVVFGENSVTARYNGNSSYNPSRTATAYNGLAHNTKITVNPIANTLYDNTVTVTGVLSDINGSIISDADVIVRINNNAYITATNLNGVYTIPNVPAVLGNNNVTVTYNGNASYNKAENSTVYTGLPHDTVITINNIKDTLFDDTVTVTGTLKDVNNTVIPYANIIVNVNGVNYTTATNTNGVYTVTQVPVVFGENNVTARYNGNASYNKAENNTKYNGLPHNTQVTVNKVKDLLFDNKTNITGILSDVNGTVIPEADITIKVNNNITYTAKTDANGVYHVSIPALLGNNNVTVTYNGNARYTASNNNTSFNGVKHATIVTVDPVVCYLGEKVRLTVHVTDINGTLISEGCVVLKLNGKTLRVDESFNSTEESLKFNLTNGTTTYKFTTDVYLKHIRDFRATYSGSDRYRYNQSSIVVARFIKREAEVTVTTNTTHAAQDTDITFIANLRDITPNAENTTALDEGFVLFKVNNKTLRDENNNDIHVQVINNTAIYTYHVPRGMAATYSNGTVRDYTVTALYSSKSFRGGTTNTTVFNVEKAQANINIDDAIMNNTSRRLTVTANITDNNGNMVVGNDKVAIKINGKTLKNQYNQTLYYTVHEGKINLTYTIPKEFTKIDTIELVTKERSAYYGANTERSIIHEIN